MATNPRTDGRSRPFHGGFGLGTASASNRRRVSWALPYLFSGMKVAMTLSVIGAVVGEFIGSDKGLGYLILTASSNMNTALVFAVVAVLSVLGILAYYAVVMVERFLCPWYQPASHEPN